MNPNITSPARIKPLVAAVMFLFVGCSAPSPEGVESEEAAGGEGISRVVLSAVALASLDLSFDTATLMALAPTLEVPAEVVPVPDRVAAIGARVSGRVVDVFVNVGDSVGPNDPLLAIESAEVGRAWADLVSARARARVTRRASDRQQELLDGRVTSVRAFEEAQGEWEVADAELQAALTRLASFGILDPGEPPANPARVALFSPITGSVTARTVLLGEWVEPSDFLMEVVDVAEVWLEASVFEHEIRYVGVGQSVQVEVRAFPDDVFLGTVDRLAGVIDEDTRSIGVLVVLENAAGRLRPGMFATARIQGAQAAEAREVLAIRSSAVQEVDGRQAVFVSAGDGAFEIRPVHTGQRVGDLVEILTGLQVGDEVVADGSFLLKGQHLRSELAEEEEG